MLEERNIRITNKLGLHVRPAAQLAELANKYQSQIAINIDKRSVNAKSIIELLTLGATEGTMLTFRAEGEDAAAALDSIQQLIENKFDEE